MLCWQACVRTLLPTSSPSWSLTWQLTSKMTFPITSPSWLLPSSRAAPATVRPWVACSKASDVLAFCPLSVTVADWQWLPAWQSFTQPPHVLGSKCYHYCGEGCHHFLPLEHGSTQSRSGSSAVAFSVVWMTRYYSSCSDKGSCTPGAIKVIHMLSPSVSKTNVELYDSTFDALWLVKWARAWRRILP